MKMTRSWWAGVAVAAALAMGAESGALIFEDTFDHGLARAGDGFGKLPAAGG